MYCIMLIVTGCFLALLYMARKEDAASDTSFLLAPFFKIARYLYKKASVHFPRLFFSRQVEKDLIQLHPGESKECLRTDYYVKKITLFLAVILIGTLFGAAAKFSAQSKAVLGGDGVVTRGDYQDGAKDISIEAHYGEQQMEFQVQVEPRKLSWEEAEELFDDFEENLPEYILGDNESLQNVRTDLVLTEEYGDYPIAVEWTSSRMDILSNSGHVVSVENEEQAVILAHLSYEGYSRAIEIDVTLTPPVFTEEELLYREMEEILQLSHDDSLEAEEWKLPSEWKGESISWEQIVEDNSLLLWGACIAAAILVYLSSDKDLHGRLEKRKKSLRREYPEIVHKLVLFVGAGMTIRGAFQKIAGDYEAKCGNGGRQSPAYEEMLYTCRELHSGISEGKSYEHFGRRTGMQEYIRLSTLLTQNLKRGNSTLLERLREEADKAAEEQLQQGRKLGEEAGTKLLVPMVLMLAVIMTIIMIPAFSNM